MDERGRELCVLDHLASVLRRSTEFAEKGKAFAGRAGAA
jgi:hypothetical protein